MIILALEDFYYTFILVMMHQHLTVFFYFDMPTYKQGTFRSTLFELAVGSSSIEKLCLGETMVGCGAAAAYLILMFSSHRNVAIIF